MHEHAAQGDWHFFDGGHGSIVLLLHGLGSCGADWAPQIQALLPHHRVIAPDLRGHGASPGVPGPWRMADLANDVLRLLERLAPGGPVHVVGFSLGGMVALELARRAPQRVASLCLINSLPLPAAKPPALLLTYWLRRAMIALFGLETLGRMLGKKLFPLPAQQDLRERFAQRMGAMSQTAYLATLDAIFHWHGPEPSTLAMPVLVLAADGDYTPVELKRRFAAGLPRGRLAVIAGSRHASTLDQPALVNQLLHDFLTTR